MNRTREEGQHPGAGAGARILYVQYTNPAAYPPLEHSSRLLAKRGWEVLFLGTGVVGADTLEFPDTPNIQEKRLAYRAPGWRQKLHYAWFCLWVIMHGIFWRPRWIYASDLLSCPPALVLALLGVRVLYHEHDSPDDSGKGIQALCLWARRKLAPRARLCVLPSEARTKVFSARNKPANVAVVWNCPSADEVGPSKPASSDGRLMLFYHGSIVPDRLPKSVILALRELPDSVSLRVAGYETTSSIGYIDSLRALAAKEGLQDRFEYLGAIPRRSELLRHCHEADVGLVLMPKNSPDINMQHMTGASNKPFDYLSGGLVLLAADLPEWRRMFIDPGYGLGCDPEDPASIANAIRWFLEHREQMRKMGENGRRRIIAEWNYESQFACAMKYLTADSRNT